MEDTPDTLGLFAALTADVLLCDHAEVAGGKLFINGAGWDQLPATGVPTALAIILHVPWDLTNQRRQLTVALYDADGQPFTQGVAPLTIEFEVGRPAGMPAGGEILVPYAVNIPPFQLTPGQSYHWQVRVDGVDLARCSFRARPE